MAMLKSGKLYIDGVLRDASGGATYDDIGPWTGEVVGVAADASAADMDDAIAAARRAFDETSWSTDASLRRELVVKLRDLALANRDRIATLARHEVGASWGTINGGPQVDLAIDNFNGVIQIFDDFSFDQDMGESTSYSITSQRMVYREAAGVVGAITAWNVPLYMAVGKIAPALLAGCTVILKPAPETPLIGAILGELAAEAGFPAGVFNVVTSKDPALVAEMLVTDPRVDMISFTGSTAIGKRIMEKAAPTLKRVFLELGGKSAGIILDDAPNYAQAVSRSMAVYHAGQGCAMITRLLLPRSRYAEGVAALKQAYAQFDAMWGDFEAQNNVMGPLSSARQRDRVMGYIESGKAEGATLLHGGGVRTDKGGGFFIEPTCFVDVDNKMKIAQEEIFGPVLAVIPYEDDEDAIRIANDSVYGLSGAVTSGNLDRAMRIVKRIRTGTFHVNHGLWNGPDMPFGGYKQSGLGREWGKAGFEEYLQTKSVGIAVGH